MESPHEDPTTPWGRVFPSVRVCACLGRRGAPSWADMQEDMETGRQPDTLSGTGRTQAAPDLASHARLPTLPTSHARLPCPVSRLSRVCHIVNRSATRAPCKTAFCQAILLFLDLSKRYTLIHNDLRDD